MQSQSLRLALSVTASLPSVGTDRYFLSGKASDDWVQCQPYQSPSVLVGAIRHAAWRESHGKVKQVT